MKPGRGRATAEERRKGIDKGPPKGGETTTKGQSGEGSSSHEKGIWAGQALRAIGRRRGMRPQRQTPWSGVRARARRPRRHQRQRQRRRKRVRCHAHLPETVDGLVHLERLLGDGLSAPRRRPELHRAEDAVDRAFLLERLLDARPVARRDRLLQPRRPEVAAALDARHVARVRLRWGVRTVGVGGTGVGRTRVDCTRVGGACVSGAGAYGIGPCVLESCGIWEGSLWGGGFRELVSRLASEAEQANGRGKEASLDPTGGRQNAHDTGEDSKVCEWQRELMGARAKEGA
eukprot:6195944-Pleurochrysis_carterae.AAC.1